MIPKIVDMVTYVTHVDECAVEFSVFWWCEGNGGCDCNRAMRGMKGIECGHNRFIIVDVAGDLEGKTKWEILLDANEDYPIELVAIAFEIYYEQQKREL